jgi:hypothetical protein
MKSYLSRRASCFYRQTASFWNGLDTLGNVMICNYLSATRRFHHFPESSMGFYEVLQGSVRFYEVPRDSMRFHKIP